VRIFARLVAVWTGMLTYYDWTDSPNCLKTKIVLLELDAPFEQVSVDRTTLRGDAYRAKFPTGMAPAIEDGEVRISESGAIALHLAARHGRLIPGEPAARARMAQAMFVEASLLSPTVGGSGLFGELYRPEAERNERRIVELRERAQQVARVLGGLLAAGPYFAGEVSIADAQLYAAVAKSIEAKVFDAPPANLVAWYERMTARPQVVRARAQYTHFR
jgi:glutathione S-transferase